MAILGLETSVREGSLALVESGCIVDERPLDPAGRRHARTLLAEIDALLRGNGLKPGDAGGFAVSIGPGSFTGLRVGVVAAKTLAWATGRPLAAVDTLLAVSENCPAEVEKLAVVANAHRGDLFVGRYQREVAGRFHAASPVSIMAADEFNRRCVAGDVVSGPGIAVIESGLPAGVRVLEQGFGLPRAAAVARLGELAIQQGRVADAWTLEPMYVRPSAAEEKRHLQPDGKCE